MFLNKVRLPYYLSRPQYLTSEEVYVTTGGDRRITESETSKQVDGRTDWIPELWHQRFIIAMRHDNVYVSTSRYTGSFRIQGEYEIDWQEFLDYPIAMAKFKGILTDFIAKKNQCGVCEDEIILVQAVSDFDATERTEGEEFDFDLRENDVYCCDTPVWELVSFNEDVVDNVTINAGTGVAHIKLKTPLVSGAYDLLVYKIVCDGEESQAILEANINGSGVATCSNVHGIFITDYPGGSQVAKTINWINPANTPALGFVASLYRMDGMTEIFVQDVPILPDTVSSNVENLLYDTTYRFKIQGICSTIPPLSSAVLTHDFTTAAAPAGNEMIINVYGDEQDVGGGMSDYTVIGDLAGAVLSNDDISIFGQINIDGTLYFYSLTIPAGTTNGQSSVVLNTSSGEVFNVTSAAPSPSSVEGDDLNTYTVITQI